MTPDDAPILLIEDEAQIRKFLRISLEAHGYPVRESRLGEDGLRLCRELEPRLVILDLGLPDLDGQDVLRSLREWSAVPVIVLSVRASENEKVLALDGGADDYVTKPFGIGELMARVRVLLRKEGAQDALPVEFDSSGLHIDYTARTVSVDGKALHLSRKEYELLVLLSHDAGRVLTHRHILASIWGERHADDTHYLRVLVGQLRQRLGDDPTRPRFIVTVQGVGYRLGLATDAR